MARKFGFLFLGLCLAIGTLGLVGCDPGRGETGILTGFWSSGTDGYVITNNTFNNTLIYFGYKDADHPEWSDYSFTGTIKNKPDFTQKAGVIIVEYTKKPIYGQYETTSPYSLTGGAPPSGSFMGIYWRDLTTVSVKLANAYDSSNTETETTTLDDAITKFTERKAGDFVDWSIVASQAKQ
jgi:hypothetical protein